MTEYKNQIVETGKILWHQDNVPLAFDRAASVQITRGGTIRVLSKCLHASTDARYILVSEDIPNYHLNLSFISIYDLTYV